jgi:hypothetical protein
MRPKTTTETAAIPAVAPGRDAERRRLLHELKSTEQMLAMKKARHADEIEGARREGAEAKARWLAAVSRQATVEKQHAATDRSVLNRIVELQGFLKATRPGCIGEFVAGLQEDLKRAEFLRPAYGRAADEARRRIPLLRQAISDSENLHLIAETEDEAMTGIRTIAARLPRGE